MVAACALRGLRVVLGIGLVCLVVGAPASVQAEGLDDAIAKADKKLVSALKSTTKWAAGKRINGFRHRTFRLILRIDPDDAKARGVLKYKRKGKGKDRTWEQRDDYKEPVDFAKGTLVKAEARNESALVAWRDALLAALEADGDEGSPRHEAVLDRMAEFMPDDETLRSLRGDVKFQGRWMMPETKMALERRAALRQVIRDHRRARDAKVGPYAAGMKAGWSSAWTTNDRTVIGSIESYAGREVLMSLEAAEGLCGHLFGKTKKPLSPVVTVLLGSSDEARRFLEGEPKYKKALAKVDRLGAVWLPGSTYLAYTPPADRLRRGAIRQLIDSGIHARFGRHGRGWITEGVGQRLCFYVDRAHGPPFVSLESTERHRTAEAADTLPEAPTDWNRAAAAILRRDGHRRLAGVLTRRLNAMKAADVLVAYGLASFLLETRPEDFLRFAEASITRHDVDALVKDTLGADDVAMLSRYLERWLREN